jgi:hypothetical protein
MRTNERLILNDEDFGWTTSEDFFREVQALVCRILGMHRIRTYSLFELYHIGALRLVPFSNGASTRVKRSETAAITKLTGIAHITESAIPYWDFLSIGTSLYDQDLQIVDGSVMFSVDKSSDIDRIACKEPEINMSMQRGVGEFIRRKLRKVGVDLRDQTINQGLAAKALSLGLATVDLSAASDSITRQLAIHCLPFALWTVCDDLRVKSTQLLNSGESHDLEMFSSMGNGFTFELESLLFYAITRVVARRSGIKGRISVYGDDIICHCKIVPRLTRLFSWLGFRVNTKKTHSTGLFRESCGKHYYNGRDVTPFYIRREVLTVSDLILHLNHIYEWDSRLTNGESMQMFFSQSLAEFHSKWVTLVPSFLWGGFDVTSNAALVTGHRYRKRIVPQLRSAKVDERPAMDLWFMTAEHGPRVGAEMMCADIKHMPSWKQPPTQRVLEVKPSKEVGYAIAANPSPSWVSQDPWDPYCLYRDHGDMGADA